MRILFSIAGLLVVLAIIGFTVKQQLNTLAPPSTPATPPPGADAPVGLPIGTPPPNVQQQVQEQVQRTLEQGAARASEADR
jgi:hypothetical protein